MTVLVTGGTGFIGSHVVRRLVGQGREVVALDISPNPENLREAKDKVRVVRGDVLDIVNLTDVIKRNHMDQIVHLAYMLTVASRENPQLALKVNCLGNNNVLEAARTTDVKRVVWASSLSVYGGDERYSDQPVDEETPIHITHGGVYGGCKILNEIMGRHYRAAYGLDNIGLRFSGIYGPGRAPTGKGAATAYWSSVIENPALGKPVRVPYVDDRYAFLYVKDAAKAIDLALEARGLQHMIFNICGSVHSFREIIDIVRRIIPDAIIETEPGTSRTPLLYSMERARLELGYEPTYDLETGIRDFVDEVRRYAQKRA
ncbi:MAG: NAD-dependent epimerase/dehydratase family protein [Candidatus Bathyarchaeia archaeon]